MGDNNYKEAWQYVMEELRNEYKNSGKENEFILWFTKMNYIEDTIDIITFSVSNPFQKTLMSSKGYFDIVQNKIREITGQSNITLNCIVTEEKAGQEEKSAQIPNDAEIREEKKEIPEEIHPEPSKIQKKHPQLREEYTFDTFIPGENSTFAYNASLAAAKNPGRQHNPILLYGGVGLGKTHLMQAIGNYIYSTNDSLKICYISAESFTNEFTAALSTKTINKFKNKYRNLDVLLLDDIHFLQGKEATQEELFYTFNALHDSNSQMVFTCDRPIREIREMTERLLSRLSNGLCIDLQPPNYETRHAILQKKTELMGKSVPNDVIDYIAKNVETNVRDLESALKRVIGYSELTNQSLNIDIVKSQLRDILTSPSAGNISLDSIQKVIADNYQISVQELKSKKRDKKFAIPRQIAIYIARQLTEYSFSELGTEFGGKDHSTIMHAYNKIDSLIKTDSSLDSKIQGFIREIKEYKK